MSVCSFSAIKLCYDDTIGIHLSFHSVEWLYYSTEQKLLHTRNSELHNVSKKKNAIPNDSDVILYWFNSSSTSDDVYLPRNQLYFSNIKNKPIQKITAFTHTSPTTEQYAHFNLLMYSSTVLFVIKTSLQVGGFEPLISTQQQTYHHTVITSAVR